MTDKKYDYDIILFGCTGFTGKLAVEYLFQKQKQLELKDTDQLPLKWAVSARNVQKAEAVIHELALAAKLAPPTILQADLMGTTDEQLETLKQVVQQTKVVLTCSGPFEKYGQSLLKLCASMGVHYADITGESDFVRTMISENDLTAQQSGAVIIPHCGNDCIPQDLTVWELHEYAKKHGCSLRQVLTYVTVHQDASLSGGTAATAAYQLGKNRNDSTTHKPAFDPLLKTPSGTKSEYITKNVSPKSNVTVKELNNITAGPWLMGPVMVNCVRRSNALLGYAKELEYGDAMVQSTSLTAWFHNVSTKFLIGGAIALPNVFQRFLPQPGEGPDRATMEAGFMDLTAIATLIDDKDGKESRVISKFHFGKDVGYLYTAALLVETGMVLRMSKKGVKGGLTTPAAALGSDLTKQILENMDASFEIKELEDHQ